MTSLEGCGGNLLDQLVRSSDGGWCARESPSLTADDYPIGHATGTS
jgi:hypothetical protein